MLREGLLIKVTPELEGRIIFVSHEWCGYSHPDPTGEQLRCFQRQLLKMLEGSAADTEPVFADRLYLPGGASVSGAEWAKLSTSERSEYEALSIALNATLIMPRLVCTCDRYWGFLENCRMPTGPEDMPLPFHCPQDALFEIKRWNDLGVRFRESSFLEHPNVPEALKAACAKYTAETPGRWGKVAAEVGGGKTGDACKKKSKEVK